MVAMGKAATAYAELGWFILPIWWVDETPCTCENGDPAGAQHYHCACPKGEEKGHKSPGKHPIGKLVPNGEHDATNDPATVEKWWSQYPNANIGRRLNGVVAWDSDPKKGGDVAWKEIENRHNNGQPFDTLTVLTGSKGLHVYQEKNGHQVTSRVGIVPGIDRLTDPYYCMVPPSNHISGRRYEWVNNSSLTSRRMMPYQDLVPSQTTEDGPHDWARRNLKPGDAWWNELLAYRRRHWKEWVTPEEGIHMMCEWSRLISHPDFTEIDEPDMARIEKYVYEALTQWKAKDAEEQRKKQSASEIVFVRADLSNVLRDTLPPRQPDLVEMWLPAGAYHTELVGREGEGKTMVSQIMLMQAALGQRVFGYFSVPVPVRTVFFQDDSPGSLMERREAAIVRNMYLDEEQERLFTKNYLAYREQGFMFRDPQAKGLRRVLQAQIDKGEPVQVVAIDSRTTSWPGDPNDQQLAADVYRTILKPICREFGALFFVISHPPKAEVDAAGNPAKLSIAGTAVHQRDADVIVHLRQRDNVPPRVVFEFKKLRDGVKGKSMIFNATIEPMPPEFGDDDPEGAFSLFRPRGWISMALADNQSLMGAKTKAQEVADGILPYLRERRSRQEVLTYVSFVLKAKASEDTVDIALDYLVAQKLAAKDKAGRETVFWSLTDLTTDPDDPTFEVNG